MSKYDVKLTGLDNLYARLNRNAHSSKKITEQDVSVSDPVEDTSVPGANTRITLSRVKGSKVVNGDSPSIERYYTRYDLADLIAEANINLKFQEPIDRFSKSKLRLKFINASRINLTSNDINIDIDENIATVTMNPRHHGIVGKVEMVFSKTESIL